MSQLKTLKNAKTLHDLAMLLEFKASSLAFILYKENDINKYKKFDIPKRNGSTRQICATIAGLRLVQQRLSNVFQNCVEEINKHANQIDRINHGFKRKRSIITNAKEHRNRKYVFNIDLKDFFGSINFGRVRGFFIKDKNFALHPDMATILAQIACYENSLPQGSPCSPIISNLIGHLLDIHLVRLASQSGCTYTRYADDLTFSTNKSDFPPRIAKQLIDNKHKWTPGNELLRLVSKSGFQINPFKTRMQYCDSRQEVTGLIVNKKVNVRSEYRHTVRAMVNRLLTTGSFEFIRTHMDKNGLEIYKKEPGKLDQLHGMLSFIDYLDLYNKNLNSKVRLTKDYSSLRSKELLYHRFLLFKLFHAAASPLIICEGKSDNIYILHAIRSLSKNYPELATTNADGSIKLNIRFFKYSGTSTGKILKINGGTGDLKNLITDYYRESKRFTAPGLKNPIILLIDNDDGAKKINSAIKEIKGQSPTSTEPYIHITKNLYLIATPLEPGKSESKIEDFFDSYTKATIIAGKTFNDKNDYDTETQYGKMVFANKVVKATADKINFSEFGKILSNIALVIHDHKKNVSSLLPIP